MIRQPTLLDNAGSEFPGPQFTPRPGWGARLIRWFSHNAFVVAFRLILLAGVILIIVSVTRSRVRGPEASLTPLPSASSSASETTTVTLRAEAGQGTTHVAARALDAWLLTRNPVVKLSPAQHLFVVDTLARQAGWRRLRVGEEVRFSPQDIEEAVLRAEALTPAQLARWTQVLRGAR